MINPVIFSIQIGAFTLAPRWYGVLVMFGTMAGAYLAYLEVKRRGGNAERIWDLLVWLVPAGVIGGRLWYVVNATLVGNDYYV